jgi:hypothetical protein
VDAETCDKESAARATGTQGRAPRPVKWVEQLLADRDELAAQLRATAAVRATPEMIAGVGLFGTFSGFVLSWFLAPRAAENRCGRRSWYCPEQ